MNKLKNHLMNVRNNKMFNIIAGILLILLAFSMSNADAKVIDFKEIYQDYLGNWYKLDATNITLHPWYLKTENSTHYILKRMDDNLTISKNITYNGTFLFRPTDISFTIVAPASKIQNISQPNGTGMRRIKIPESAKSTYKRFTWDNKKPVVILTNETWNMTVIESDYWYSRQNGNLWFNFKTANVTGLPADVNASFYFTTWVIDNATTAGWSTANVSLNGSRWTNDGSLALNQRNDSSLNMSGVVAYWSADETTGTIWHQVNTESGQVNETNQGTWYGNTTVNYSTGKIGNAGLFDGMNDYVDMGNDPSLNFGTGDFSVETWIKTTDTVAGVLGKIDDVTEQGFYFGMSYDGQLYFAIGDGVSSNEVLSIIQVTNNVWHHIVAVRDNTANELKFYANGILKDSTTITVSDLDVVTNLTLGWEEVNNEFYNGSIDEVRIYNRALSSEEIAVSYNTSLRTIAMPAILNQTAQVGNTINRTRITYSGQDTINNASIYARQNGTTTWSLVQANATSNTWYSISPQFNVMDFGIMMQGNGSNTPFFSSLEWDETLVPIPTPTPTPTPVPPGYNLTTNLTYMLENTANQTLYAVPSNSSFLLVYPFNQDMIILLLTTITMCLLFIVIYIIYKETMR